MKRISAFVALFIGFSVFAESKLDISGFARLVGGYLDEEFATYQGYDNSLSFSADSLIGAKAEYTFNDKWSLVAQGIVTESDERKSGLDWLYVSYQPDRDWKIDIGRYRTPFLEYSEVVDVGFSYPWVIPPQTVYGNLLFSSVEGAKVTRQFSVGDTNLVLTAFGGRFDGLLFDADGGANSEVDLLSGVNLRLNSGGFRARLSYVKGDFELDINGLTELQDGLRLAGFEDTANVLEINDEVDLIQASLGYDKLNYFFIGEVSLIDGKSRLAPQVKGGYVTAGLFDDSLTYYASLSVFRTSNRFIENNVPLGLDPRLDVLSVGVDRFIDGRIQDSIDTLTLGVRWDILPNLAFKTEVSLLNGRDGERASFSNVDEENFNRQAAVYLFSVDWLF